MPCTHTTAHGMSKRRCPNMTPEELRQILDTHDTWTATRGKEGLRANFVEADLKSVNLEAINLAGANFKCADLRQAVLQRAR